MTHIRRVMIHPLEIELSEPFGIATGAQLVAQNVVVELELEDGTRGLGEAAPFPAFNGETQRDAQLALERVQGALLGRDVCRWRRVTDGLDAALEAAPSARAALETAALDAWCRTLGINLWQWAGATETELHTDITIPTGSVERAAEAAVKATSRGFQVLKIKVGGHTASHDLERLQAITRVAPSARLVLDANASLSSDAALGLLDALAADVDRVILFEQPTGKYDLAGLRRVRTLSGIPVAADESACSASDVLQLGHEQAADVINIKLTKSALCGALEMIAVARAAGLRLMIGGMVESSLMMSVSASLAAGIGGFDFVDLDTPLFMKNAPFNGGPFANVISQQGPLLRLAETGPGHGVRWRNQSE